MINIGGYTLLKPESMSEEEFIREAELLIAAYEAQMDNHAGKSNKD